MSLEGSTSPSNSSAPVVVRPSISCAAISSAGEDAPVRGVTRDMGELLAASLGVGVREGVLAGVLVGVDDGPAGA